MCEPVSVQCVERLLFVFLDKEAHFHFLLSLPSIVPLYITIFKVDITRCDSSPNCTPHHRHSFPSHHSHHPSHSYQSFISSFSFFSSFSSLSSFSSILSSFSSFSSSSSRSWSRRRLSDVHQQMTFLGVDSCMQACPKRCPRLIRYSNIFRCPTTLSLSSSSLLSL